MKVLVSLERVRDEYPLSQFSIDLADALKKKYKSCAVENIEPDGLDVISIVEHAVTRPFHLLVLGVFMSNLDGLGLSVALRRAEKFESITIVIVTSLESQIRDEEFSAVDAVVSTPCEVEKVMEKISEAVEARTAKVFAK